MIVDKTELSLPTPFKLGVRRIRPSSPPMEDGVEAYLPIQDRF